MVYCDLCLTEIEDGDHILFACSFAQQCWDYMHTVYPLPLWLFGLTELENSLASPAVDHQRKNCFAYVTWSLWKAQNERVFQNVNNTPVHVACMALGWLPYSCRCSLSLQVGDRSWRWEARETSNLNGCMPEQVRWLHPSTGFLKLNFDKNAYPY